LLDRALASSGSPIQPFRDVLANAHRSLADRFRANESVETLVRFRARVIDQAVLAAWDHFAAGLRDRCALVAVGGYGRGELHPHSDIDLLILTRRAMRRDEREHIKGFLAFLWDIGLAVGNSARTVRDCVNEARSDVTVATNLMDGRLVCGSAGLFARMREHTGPQPIWSSRRFFEAKMAEQRARHHR